MIKFLDDQKKFSHLGKPTELGMFALDDGSSHLFWQKCREQFGNKFSENARGLYFCHRPGNGENIAAFLAKTEDILDLPTTDRSQFANTHADYALWICPAKFWMSCRIRRSLLTIIIRAGSAYDLTKDNYEEALYENEHVRDTKPAVIRFLFGFTNYLDDEIAFGIKQQFISSTAGWVAAFKSKGVEQIRQQLTIPDHTSSLVGAGHLWD